MARASRRRTLSGESLIAQVLAGAGALKSQRSRRRYADLRRHRRLHRRPARPRDAVYRPPSVVFIPPEIRPLRTYLTGTGALVVSDDPEHRSRDRHARERLAALDLPRQNAQVLRLPEYQDPAFLLRYLAACGRRSPRGALRAARIGLALAQQLPRRLASPYRWCSLQVHALAAIADAHLALDDPAGAAGALRVARLVFLGGADRLARADLLQREARLHRVRYRPGDAERCLDEVIAIYRPLRQHHAWGCALVDRGIVRIDASQPWQAASDLYEAVTLVDRKRSARYYYGAAHHLAVALADDPEASPAEALHWLRYAQRINRQPASSFSQLKLLWAEGRILERRGMLEAAEHFLQTVRARLLEHDSAGDYTLASLDLAGIYLKQDRPRKVRTLAAELGPVLGKLAGDREAVSRLVDFHRVARREALDLELLRAVKGVFKTRTRATL